MGSSYNVNYSRTDDDLIFILKIVRVWGGCAYDRESFNNTHVIWKLGSMKSDRGERSDCNEEG